MLKSAWLLFLAADVVVFVIFFVQSKYTKGIYMIADEKEYWALGTEAWFDACNRTSLNDGINRRDKVKSHDPDLAKMLEEVYGNGDWRYDFSPYTPAFPEGSQ